MGRFCENCGTELGQGVKFCPNCGKNTGEGTSSESKKTGSSGRVSIQPKTVKASERHQYPSGCCYGHRVSGGRF